MKKGIQNVPISAIRILNPRFRDKKKFAVVVESIRLLGLKKPVKVSRNEDPEDSPTPYDLICGQGRIEAFRELGYSEIPAEIVKVSKEDRMLMSLVENMARRFPRPADLMAEIERLKSNGDSNVMIGKKLGISDSRVGDFLLLKEKGEERLLNAALSGSISVGIATDIAKAETIEAQRELLKAYQEKKLTQTAIRTVRRLIEERRFFGKSKQAPKSNGQKVTTAEGMVKAYRSETQRMRDLVKKAKICEEKIVFLTTAFKRLLADENFVNLLTAEKALGIPEFFRERISPSPRQRS